MDHFSPNRLELLIDNKYRVFIMHAGAASLQPLHPYFYDHGISILNRFGQELNIILLILHSQADKFYKQSRHSIVSRIDKPAT